MRKHEPGLYEHSLRVGRLASDFYRFCGMEFHRGWSFVEGALLHDLGKLCLPAELLSKPNGLSEEEKRMVALHPTIGAQMLEAQGHFGKAVINIVRHHHERLDGTGYPDGWQSRRTAKAVRTVAVCDALCAMTEDRPYEDGWPWQEALERLKSMGAQYDSEVVVKLEIMIRERGTSFRLHESVNLPGKRTSPAKRPKSAFYAPRRRKGTPSAPASGSPEKGE